MKVFLFCSLLFIIGLFDKGDSNPNLPVRNAKTEYENGYNACKKKIQTKTETELRKYLQVTDSMQQFGSNKLWKYYKQGFLKCLDEKLSPKEEYELGIQKCEEIVSNAKSRTDGVADAKTYIRNIQFGPDYNKGFQKCVDDQDFISKRAAFDFLPKKNLGDSLDQLKKKIGDLSNAI